jgi:hypothetical protein
MTKSESDACYTTPRPRWSLRMHRPGGTRGFPSGPITDRSPACSSSGNDLGSLGLGT